MTKDKKRRRGWRRFFQFRLLGLLLLTLVCSILLAIWSTLLRPHDREQAALVELQARGEGESGFLFSSELEITKAHRQPAWLKAIAGEINGDFFSRTIDIQLNGLDIADDQLQQVAHLSYLERLNLDNTLISDRGLGHLRKLSHLKFLWLSGTEITDRGVQQIAKLDTLESLGLGNTQVTDACTRFLNAMPNLRQVELTGTTITDDGLHQLCQRKTLVTLALAGTRVSDRGLAVLTNLPALNQLYLNELSSTDEGMKHIGKLTSLRELSLSGSRITDAGLKHLEQLPNLRILWLDPSTGSGITSIGISSLMSKLPQLKITRG